MRTVLFIFQKETLQVLRDRTMILQIAVMPVIQLLVLAQAMSYEVKHTDLALVDLDRTAGSERLVERFTASGRFSASVVTASGDVADRTLLTREAGAVLRIPAGFGRELARGQSPQVQLVLNAEDGAAAGVVSAYAGQILAQFSQAEARPGVGPLGAGRGAVRPVASGAGVEVQTRKLYNPQGEYLAYMAIGLLATIVTLVGVLLAAQNIAREQEIGTLEQLNVTPISKGQFIAGKLAPFWVLGLVELTLGLAVIRLGFGTPFAGPIAAVYVGAAVYLFAALGLGLLVSTSVQTQQQAMFVTFFILMSLFMFGGIFTPVVSMPGWAQGLAALNPMQHFAAILRTVLMKGGGVADVLPQLGAMAAFAAVVLPLAYLRYQKTAS